MSINKVNKQYLEMFINNLNGFIDDLIVVLPDEKKLSNIKSNFSMMKRFQSSKLYLIKVYYKELISYKQNIIIEDGDFFRSLIVEQKRFDEYPDLSSLFLIILNLLEQDDTKDKNFCWQYLKVLLALSEKFVQSM